MKIKRIIGVSLLSSIFVEFNCFIINANGWEFFILYWLLVLSAFSLVGLIIWLFK